MLMPGADCYETPWLDTLTAPATVVFITIIRFFGYPLHTEIQWMSGVTAPLSPSLQATVEHSSTREEIEGIDRHL